jgi:hypothetical protein
MPFIGSQPPRAALSSAHISDGAVNSDEIATGAVDLAHMSSQSVDEDNLHISNAGSNGQFLSKQSGDTGGLTWAAAAQFANWTQSSGHLTPDNATYGIHLGVATATAANLLNDYETGVWTPTLISYSGTAPTVTYSVQTGLYTKIGRMLNLFAYIQTASYTGGSSPTYMLIGGLPFAIDSGTPRATGAVDFEQVAIDDTLGANVADNVATRLWNTPDGMLLALSQSGGSGNYITWADWPSGSWGSFTTTMTYSDSSLE